MRLFLIILIVFTSATAYAQQSIFIDVKNGFALGLTLGAERAPFEVYLPEDRESSIGEPYVAMTGIVARLKYNFAFFRTGVTNGIQFLGGSGKYADGTETSLTISHVDVPFSLGLNLPLSSGTSVFIGPGYSYMLASAAIKSGTTENTYSYTGGALHIIIGSEVALTESGVVTFEWLHTTGMSGSIESNGTQTRELSLRTDQFLFGYSYYFPILGT